MMRARRERFALSLLFPTQLRVCTKPLGAVRTELRAVASFGVRRAERKRTPVDLFHAVAAAAGVALTDPIRSNRIGSDRIEMLTDREAASARRRSEPSQAEPVPVAAPAPVPVRSGTIRSDRTQRLARAMHERTIERRSDSLDFRSTLQLAPSDQAQLISGCRTTEQIAPSSLLLSLATSRCLSRQPSSTNRTKSN